MLPDFGCTKRKMVISIAGAKSAITDFRSDEALKRIRTIIVHVAEDGFMRDGLR